MAAPARKSGGASASLRPANQHDLPFEVIEISPVGLKNPLPKPPLSRIQRRWLRRPSHWC